MFQSGNILRIENFDFEDGKSLLRDKFLIVLLTVDSFSIIAPLTTSKDYIPDHYKNQKCIKDDQANIHCYFIPQNQSIGISNFSFPKNTYIHINPSNLKKRSVQDLNEKYSFKGLIELKDVLKDSEYSEILYCFYKSSHLPRGIKKIMEPIIEELEIKLSRGI